MGDNGKENGNDYGGLCKVEGLGLRTSYLLGRILCKVVRLPLPHFLMTAIPMLLDKV